MPDTEATQMQDTNQPTKAEDTEGKEEMCCDGERTAADHRKESADGKCCVD